MCNSELTQILISNRCIGADIDNLDQVITFLTAQFCQLRYSASGNQCLSKTNFI